MAEDGRKFSKIYSPAKYKIYVDDDVHNDVVYIVYTVTLDVFPALRII